ncbi:unnamed protein product [Spirodela intermedia]|uniref:Myb/SANT-like DNA-binding domain-containing protein n=1 Tax=Spirodela intermedia TaxID=51605 RepID=A0A7I8IT11_SPIIN|nr:unnamed protein product [Spirodela intermedia]CAA6661151.1 unnamed protein product [Spirodela intermedia]
MEGREGAGAAKPPNPALPYREDCWSEGATSTLIDAWGDRFLELNRGTCARSSGRRPPRSDIQCKNRIDTLKKKYKVEKARITNSGGALSSQWAFFDRLDALIGSSEVSSHKPSPPPPLAFPLPYRKNSSLPSASVAASQSTARDKRHTLKYSAAAAAAAAAAAERKDEEAGPESSKSSTERPTRGRGQRGSNNGSVAGSDNDDAEAVRELARAILRFGEVYERVEAEKQRQMMELEKERMEFTKGLEFQRMQIFVDCQLQLEKSKRAKRDPSGTFLALQS